MKLIHLGTKVLTEFGIIDDNGNVVQKMAVTGEGNAPYNISVFTLDAFTDAFRNLDKARDELLKQVEKLEQQSKALQEQKAPVVES